MLQRVQQVLQQVHEEVRPVGTAAVEADAASGEAASAEAAGQADLCWPLALDVLAASRNSAACRTVTRCRVGGRLALGGTEGVGGTPYLVLHVQDRKPNPNPNPYPYPNPHPNPNPRARPSRCTRSGT